MKIKIQKGHNIRISGVPTGAVEMADKFQEFGIVPADYLGIKPKLVVKAGDKVELGSALFFDKKNPQVYYPSQAGGTIKEIIYGERRIIKKIVIATDDDEAIATLDTLVVESSNRLDIIKYILEANLWPLIRQRPFNITARPEDTPKAIFISGIDTAPLSIDPTMALKGREGEFRTGLQVLTKLSGGAVHLTVPAGSSAEVFNNLNGITIHQISGPHPAGNVGIQIHHIDPINPGDIIWTVNVQHVATLGSLFKTGQYDPTVLIAVGGPAVKNPEFLQTRIGAPLSNLVQDNLNTTANRVISGDVLTGRAAEGEDYLGFYHSTISVLSIDHQRPFLGWAKIGNSTREYTLTNAYLKTGKRNFSFSTKLNGARRAIVPINAWEDVLPMDIMPNALFRSILAQDVEEMEKLGILECDPEDFALSTFGCPSKIELSSVIRQGLELMEKEM